MKKELNLTHVKPQPCVSSGRDSEKVLRCHSDTTSGYGKRHLSQLLMKLYIQQLL